MVITSKLTERDFINASLVLLYSKTSTKVIAGIFILFIAVLIMEGGLLQHASFFQLIYPLIVFGISPVLTYFSAKRSFSVNKTNGETIEYHFDDNCISTKGETFSSQMEWKNIYKVTQTENWILIWRSRQVANPIPKRDIKNTDQLSELKRILDMNNVKNNF